jgi:CRISPR-associated protein Csd2
MTVSANLAEKVGFTENDLKILLESVVQMYNNDASASKMGMSVLTPVVIFKHVGFDTSPADQREREAKLGCVSAYKLFDLIAIEKKDGIDVPRAYSDYDIKLKLNELPSGVECGLKHNAFEDIVWYTTTNETYALKVCPPKQHFHQPPTRRSLLWAIGDAFHPGTTRQDRHNDHSHI